MEGDEEADPDAGHALRTHGAVDRPSWQRPGGLDASDAAYRLQRDGRSALVSGDQLAWDRRQHSSFRTAVDVPVLFSARRLGLRSVRRWQDGLPRRLWRVSLP